jgi:hypothetical protein
MYSETGLEVCENWVIDLDCVHAFIVKTNTDSRSCLLRVAVACNLSILMLKTRFLGMHIVEANVLLISNPFPVFISGVSRFFPNLADNN